MSVVYLNTLIRVNGRNNAVYYLTGKQKSASNFTIITGETSDSKEVHILMRLSTLNILLKC